MRIGSLFSGAGGLEQGVQAVFGGDVVWQCEPEMIRDKKDGPLRPNPTLKVLERRYPGVPNLGDITLVDWSTVEPVDIICGGFPCQDLSAAGRRAGLREGTRSGLWIHMAAAIAALQPKWVVIENVRGLLSSKAHRSVDGPDSDVEPEDAALGDGADGPLLRAAGAVLGDLADLGYDAVWATVSAATVGAPHRRERVFVIAVPAGQRASAARFARGVADAAVEFSAVLSAGDDGEAVDASGTGAGDRDSAGDSAEGVRVVGGGAGPVEAGGGDVVADADHWGREGGAEQDEWAATGVAASRRGDVDGCGGDVAVSEGVGRGEGRAESAGVVGGSDVAVGGVTAGVGGLLPTPRASRGASTTETSYALGGQRSDTDRVQGEVLLPSPCAGDGAAGRPWGRNGTQINLPGVARQLAGDEDVLPREGSRFHGAKPDATHYLPTPCAQQSGNTPENHLAKKPGRKQVTDLAILVENGLLETGGELPLDIESVEAEGYLPTPTSRDHKGRNQRDDETCLTGALLPTPVSSDYKGADPEKVSWENATKSRGEGGASSLGDIAPLLAPLLPTPAAQDGGGPHGDRGGYRPSRAGRQQSLSDALTAPALLPTPAASDGDGGKTSRSGDRKDEPLLGNIAALLPTPNAADGDRGKGPRSEEKLAQTRQGDNRLDRQKGLPDLPRLLPTPAAADSDRRQDYARENRDGSGGDDLVTAAVKATNTQQWGKYAPAIERWEAVTRPAPPPTEPNTKGNPRLSPAFSEWLMGWPEGWVTEPGLISRNDQLRTIGNGVVPAQAAAALRSLLMIIAQDAG